MTFATIRPRAVLPVPGDEDLKGHVFDDYPDAAVAANFPGRAAAAGDSTVCSRKVVTVVDADDNTVGAIAAHGYVHGRLHLTPDAWYAELLVSWPQTQTWSHARCEFLKHQARLLCIADYEKTSEELVARLRAVAPHATLLLTFVGDWDETSEPLRKRLASRMLKSYLAPATATPMALAA